VLIFQNFEFLVRVDPARRDIVLLRVNLDDVDGDLELLSDLAVKEVVVLTALDNVRCPRCGGNMLLEELGAQLVVWYNVSRCAR